MKTFIGSANSPSGAPLEGVIVTVTDHYSGDAVVLYEDDETTVITTLESDENGRYRFKADPGLFDLTYTGAGTGSDEAVPHADGGPLLIMTAGESIGFGKVCYVSGANAAKLAKNDGTDVEAAASLICVTRGGRTSTQAGAFTGPCSFGGFSGLTAAGTVFLGTAGGVTTTEPATAIVLGQALSTTRIDFRPTGPAADAPVGGGDIDWASPVSIAAATTITSTGIGKNHVCSGSGYNLDFNYTGISAGDVIAFEMDSPTACVVLDAGVGKTINGLRYRFMWSTETCILKWDGSATWKKVGGLSIPMVCSLQRTTAQSIAGFAWVQVACTTVVSDNTAGLTAPLGNVTTGRAEVIRPGKYFASGFISLTGLTPAVETNGGVARGTTVPGDNPNAFTTVPVPSSGNVAFSGSGVFDCAAGDWLAPIVFHGDAAARNTRAVSTVLPSLSVAEIVTW